MAFIAHGILFCLKPCSDEVSNVKRSIQLHYAYIRCRQELYTNTAQLISSLPWQYSNVQHTIIIISSLLAHLHSVILLTLKLSRAGQF